MQLKLSTGVIITREEAIDALRELLTISELANKQADPCFVRWPDLHALLDYLDAEGLPAKQS